MDVSTDEVRRAAREAHAEHVATMRSIRDAVSRLFGDARATAQDKDDAVTGGLNRRQLFRVGGLGIATAAIAAACGNGGSSGGAAEATTTTTAGPTSNDLTILRTATSLELLAVDVYGKAIASGLLTTPAVAEAAKLFQSHHQDHADFLAGLTKRYGGTAFDKPNPVVAQQLQGPLSQATTEPALVTLALQIEQAAAASYMSYVGKYTTPVLVQPTMSVGGIEARHVAVLAPVVNQPAVPASFQAATGAVAPGTGV
ncbi:MAG TPA: ferritin-like domain-containing protein [Acidimicrobiales bacterium]|nr:ferritin-like domain-containing protein [Acidimicrobiales bacterium]